MKTSAEQASTIHNKSDSAVEKDFRMHPHLLYDVIMRQAGTLGKALLEGVKKSSASDFQKLEPAQRALRLHLKFLASLNPGWLRCVTGNVGVLNEAYLASEEALGSEEMQKIRPRNSL